jgi:hypothetical protein
MFVKYDGTVYQVAVPHSVAAGSTVNLKFDHPQPAPSLPRAPERAPHAALAAVGLVLPPTPVACEEAADQQKLQEAAQAAPPVAEGAGPNLLAAAGAGVDHMVATTAGKSDEQKLAELAVLVFGAGGTTAMEEN